jgi:hypothetical protein
MRYFKSRRDFIDREAGEKSQLNDLRLPRIRQFKFLKRLINGHYIQIALSTKIESFIQWQADRYGPASSLARARDSIAYQNAAHRACSKRNNVCFIAPGVVRLFEHAQKRFVQQSCWLKGVTCALVPQIFRSQSTQLFVRCRRQFNGL